MPSISATGPPIKAAALSVHNDPPILRLSDRDPPLGDLSDGHVLLAWLNASANRPDGGRLWRRALRRRGIEVRRRESSRRRAAR